MPGKKVKGEKWRESMESKFGPKWREHMRSIARKGGKNSNTGGFADGEKGRQRAIKGGRISRKRKVHENVRIVVK